MNIIDKYNIKVLDKYRDLMTECCEVDFGDYSHFERLAHNFRALAKDIDSFVCQNRDNNFVIELYSNFPEED